MHQVRKDNAENMLTISLWPANAASGSAHLYSPCFAAPNSPPPARFVPGSHTEAQLRPHGPLHGDRSKSHTLVAEIREGDRMVPATLKRGDVTVHHE